MIVCVDKDLLVFDGICGWSVHDYITPFGYTVPLQRYAHSLGQLHMIAKCLTYNVAPPKKLVTTSIAYHPEVGFYVIRNNMTITLQPRGMVPYCESGNYRDAINAAYALHNHDLSAAFDFFCDKKVNGAQNMKRHAIKLNAQDIERCLKESGVELMPFKDIVSLFTVNKRLST